jgi:hypothetical protein
LEELKVMARPLHEEDYRRQEELRRERHPELFRDLGRLQKARLEKVADLKATLADELRAEFQRHLDDLDADIRSILESSHMTKRLIWPFERPEDGWRFQVLEALLSDLERLRSIESDVKRRLAYADPVRERTLRDHAEAWNLCIDAIRQSPNYRGLPLRPRSKPAQDSMRPGALRLIPSAGRRSAWRRDYDALREARIFGEAPSFEDLRDVVARFERRFNSMFPPRVSG